MNVTVKLWALLVKETESGLVTPLCLEKPSSSYHGDKCSRRHLSLLMSKLRAYFLPERSHSLELFCLLFGFGF